MIPSRVRSLVANLNIAGRARLKYPKRARIAILVVILIGRRCQKLGGNQHSVDSRFRLEVNVHEEQNRAHETPTGT
jgi:hypothetical protein